MKYININGNLRKFISKSHLKNLRNNFLIPCVLYSKNTVIHFSINYNNFISDLTNCNNKLVNILINDTQKKYDAIIQDIQFHPVSDQIIHIDFMMINNETNVKVNIPIKIFGKSPGIQSGGKLHINMRSIYVRGLIKDLPQEFKINIGQLNIGDVIQIKDILADNISILNDNNSTILKIAMSKAMISDKNQSKENK
ncbi:MAG: 50S ribosomal protein L25 [Bacteroides sp.]|nr:MAG: 50S ribosomal protein L25 [Bacteroides sp.]